MYLLVASEVFIESIFYALIFLAFIDANMKNSHLIYLAFTHMPNKWICFVLLFAVIFESIYNWIKNLKVGKYINLLGYKIPLWE